MFVFRILREGLGGAEEVAVSPSKREYQRVMQENLGQTDLASSRILSYQATKPPTAPDSHSNNLKVLYSASKAQPTPRKSTRHIPQVK